MGSYPWRGRRCGGFARRADCRQAVGPAIVAQQWASGVACNTAAMPEYLMASFARSAVRLAPGARVEILASDESDLPVRKLRIESRYLAPPNDALAIGLDLRVWGSEDDI